MGLAVSKTLCLQYLSVPFSNNSHDPIGITKNKRPNQFTLDLEARNYNMPQEGYKTEQVYTYYKNLVIIMKMIINLIGSIS